MRLEDNGQRGLARSRKEAQQSPHLVLCGVIPYEKATPGSSFRVLPEKPFFSCAAANTDGAQSRPPLGYR